MRYGIRHVDVLRYLPHALGATAAVIFVPVALAAGLVAAADPDPHPIVSSLVALLLALLATVLGSALWMRRPESSDISFGELMLWGWWRRKQADDRVEEGSKLLGLDPSGKPLELPRLSPLQQLDVLHDLTRGLESKDPYTHGHSRRVERHSYRTALEMGLPVTEIEDLRKAAALHDVGKVRIPDRILRKPGRLTADEMEVVQSHASVGGWMVSKVGSAEVVAAVRHHHERWDGNGYPDGLRGTEIPLLARIIAVADAYDAMTSTRPYRASLGKDPAVETLKEQAGVQFDPEVVDAFLTTLRRPAAVPVASLLILLAGPRRMLRDAAVVMKRVGAGSLAPAAGAAGAAVVLGSSVLAPPLGTPAPPPPAAVPQAIDDSRSGLTVDGGKVDVQRKERAPVRLDRDRRNDDASNSRRRPRGGSVAIAAPAGQGGDRAASLDVAEAPRDVTGDGVSPDPEPKPPEPEAQSKGEPEAEERDTPRARRDPQPDRGRDCPNRGKGKGRGPRYHCGD